MNKLGIFMNFWERKWGADHRYYINKVADMGYDILEFQAQPLLDMSDDECRAIKKEADRRGIELSYSLGLDPYYDIASRDKETRQRGIKYLKDIVYKIAVMGDMDSVLGFKALGLDVCPVTTPEEGREALHRMAKENYAILFITENLAIEIGDDIAAYREQATPAVILIPSKDGTAGIGMTNIRESVIRAVGADILFKN